MPCKPTMHSMLLVVRILLGCCHAVGTFCLLSVCASSCCNCSDAAAACGGLCCLMLCRIGPFYNSPQHCSWGSTCRLQQVLQEVKDSGRNSTPKAAARQPAVTIHASNSALTDVVPSPDGARIASTARDGVLRLHDLNSGALIAGFKVRGHAVLEHLAFASLDS